ncbi:MAG: hypothetical protein KGY57_06390, partial [Gammaproteobacteria bacterium]|nr:hypothetical protein [Gammaproteobacteria bacterium]
MSTVVALERLLEQSQPDPFILVSDDPALINAVSAVNLWHANGENAWRLIDTAPRAQLAVIDADASVPAEQAALVTARLRDVYAERVVIAGPTDADRPLNRQLLTSLGFHQIGHSEDTSGNRCWYQFDIDNYKVTPD